MFTKRLKNIQWMNTRVGKGFFKEKMTSLKEFIPTVCKTYRRKHFIHGIKTVKLSIEILIKITLIRNYTCSRSINKISHLGLAKYL